MFLFKNTKSKVKRIGMNMAVYGFSGIFVLMMLSLFLPETIANYVYILTTISSLVAIIGSILSIVWFFIELFVFTKVTTVSNNPQPKPVEYKYTGICLFDEGDRYEGTHIELHFENNGEISIHVIGWWPVHRGASNGGQYTLKLDSDYFIKNSIEDFEQFLTSELKKDFSDLKDKQEIVKLFDIPVFGMKTPEGQQRLFTYCGHNRYSPNRSSTNGYGSDDWMYLCEENGKNYILTFSVDASYGPGWMCTELLDGDVEKLTKEDVNFWGSVVYSKEHNSTYSIYLTDVDRVRHLLPTSSRCGKLTDESFMR